MLSERELKEADGLVKWFEDAGMLAYSKLIKALVTDARISQDLVIVQDRGDWSAARLHALARAESMFSMPGDAERVATLTQMAEDWQKVQSDQFEKAHGRRRMMAEPVDEEEDDGDELNGLDVALGTAFTCLACGQVQALHPDSRLAPEDRVCDGCRAVYKARESRADQSAPGGNDAEV